MASLLKVVLLLSIVTLALCATKSGESDSKESEEQQHLTPSSGSQFVKDPFLFYKWPGFGQAEGVYGRWPYYPFFFVEKEKKKKDGEEDDVQDDVQDDEDEEEDDEDEPQDDFFHNKHKHHHHHHHHDHKPWKKQKPTAVSSIGVSPPSDPWEEKATWWGVLRPKVRSGLDLNLNQESYEQLDSYEEDGEEEDEGQDDLLEEDLQRVWVTGDGSVRHLGSDYRGQSPSLYYVPEPYPYRSSGYYGGYY